MKKLLCTAAISLACNLNAMDMDTAINLWRGIGFVEEKLPPIEKDCLGYKKRRLTETDSLIMLMEQNEKQVVLVGPCEPCLALAIECANGMVVYHLVTGTARCLDMSTNDLIGWFNDEAEKLENVTRCVIFTKPFLWDDALHKFQREWGATMKKIAEKRFSGAEIHGWIFADKGGDPTIALVWDGQKFTFHSPQDLSFVFFSFGSGKGIHFDELRKSYDANKESFDECEERKSYFEAMDVFVQLSRELLKNARFTDWLFEKIWERFQRSFESTGSVAELKTCLWERKVRLEEMQEALKAIKEETVEEEIVKVFIRYMFEYYYVSALLAEYLENLSVFSDLE
jgi:hypothetical protein